MGIKSTLGLLLFLLLSAPPCFAFNPPTLADLTLPQIDDVFKVFGANFAFRPLEPASDYGKNWGATAGLIVGITDSSKLTSSIPQVTQSYVPNAMIMVGAHGPYGFGVEGGYLPPADIGGFHARQLGGDVKWTFTDLFQNPPCDAAVRAGYSSTSIDYSQAVGGVNDTLAYKTGTTSTSLSISKKLVGSEPFAGAGYIKLKGTLSNSGSFALYDQSVTQSNSYENRSESAWFFGGVQLRFMSFTVTVEYDSIFGVSLGSAKLALKF